MPLILEVEAAYEAAKKDSAFARELAYYLKHYAGRAKPSLLRRGADPAF